MENRENPLFGRKVFFLNPPLSVENYVIDSLKEEEYEVYVIEDYHDAKPMLKVNPDAICFIYIDDVLPVMAWYNFIKSFEFEDSFKSIFLGVLSAKIRPEEREKFVMDLKLPGGFVDLNQNLEIMSNQIKGILEINGAKGCRKYLRLDCKNSKDCNGYLARGDRLFSFRLVDVSSSGFACVTAENLKVIFNKGTVVNNISLTLGKKSFTCSTIVYDSKIFNGSCLVVMLFAENTRIEIRNVIRNYIYDVLEERCKTAMASSIKDLEDYTVDMKFTVNENTQNPEISESEGIFDNLEELPEISDLNDGFNNINPTDDMI